LSAIETETLNAEKQSRRKGLRENNSRRYQRETVSALRPKFLRLFLPDRFQLDHIYQKGKGHREVNITLGNFEQQAFGH
jgi:hypothetical protein